ncbi:MAG TPA: hypothetical protein VJ889_02625, partial [Pseudomonas sp.]|nr:hypothetical protein [Pseudomonas sp.]
VEQGGLADVRSAHQGDYGNHAALHFVISENTKAAARQRLVLGAITLSFVGASLLAKNAKTPRLFRPPTSSLTSIASKLAPTVLQTVKPLGG